MAVYILHDTESAYASHNPSSAPLMPTNDIHQQNNTPQSMNDLGLLLSVSEVQRVLGLGLNSTYNLIRSGQLKSIRVGKLIKVPRPALEEYLNSYKK